MNLREDIQRQIIFLAKEFNLERVILFGSRARSDNRERSDIDLALEGELAACIEFSLAAEENISTLLMFDFVIVDETLSAELSAAIKKEGVVLYEKI